MSFYKKLITWFLAVIINNLKIDIRSKFGRDSVQWKNWLQPENGWNKFRLNLMQQMQGIMTRLEHLVVVLRAELDLQESFTSMAASEIGLFLWLLLLYSYQKYVSKNIFTVRILFSNSTDGLTKHKTIY